MAAPSYRRASPKARKALIEAGLVESNLSTPNQAASDRDSEGALQQRPSQGWGPTSESNTTDAEQFLRRAIPLASKYGNAGALAQAVQRSAFPSRYNQRSAEAAALMGLRGGTVSAEGGGGGTTTTRIPGQTITTQIPTVDKAGFEQARKLAIVGGLIARHNPNSFLLRSGLLSTQEPTLSSFMGSKTVKDVIPGATVRTPATASSASIVSGSARTPVGRKAEVIGTPHAGTHTLGNWQSDNAVDIAVPEGSPMVALQSGVVVKVRHHPQDGGRFAGDQITIRGANGNEYFYAHGVASVRPGQRIRKGQRLGRTGSANGVAHLHFGQMRGDPRQHT